MPVTLIDTHCHLDADPMGRDVPGVLARAAAAGVTAIVVPGVDLPTSAGAVALARERPQVLAAIGVHPDVVDAEKSVDLDGLDRLVRAGGVAAIGEVGLDRVGPGRDVEAQESALRGQVALARNHGLPLLVHCRAAFDRLVAILESFGPHPAGGILHAWNGSAEVADRLWRLGFLVGVGGVATRAEARRAGATLRAIPLDRMVLETDAPYIGTARSPKGRVEPADLPEVASALAALKGVTPDVVAAVTTANARRLLRMGGT
jgi:TatD DNase family protein